MVEDQQLLFHHQHQPQQRLTQGHSRYGMRGSGPGEIVEVQGGHIVRSTGRKDRHSKVCTAKGPRDRRVRLSAHTAIQFYDVQDRLGYDRPSKAVDWLIKNAKAAIDELAERPPWHPTATTTTSTSAPSHPPPQPSDQPDAPEPPANPNGDSGKKPMQLAEHAYAFGTASGSGGDGTGSSFLPPSLASDAIADTIKSFFPMAATANTAPSSRSPIGYRNYPPDLLSRTSSQAQDLRLSLQSFQDSSIFHQPTHHHHHHTHSAATHQALLSASAGLPFDAVSASWSEHNPRLIPWNVAEAASGSAGSGYVFNVPPPPQAVPLHPVLGQTQIFSQQRGPLQSSHSPSVRAWADPVAAAEHAMHPALHPSPAPPVGFVPVGAGGFGGFHIPARIQGEEEHDGGSSKPSSASSASHH